MPTLDAPPCQHTDMSRVAPCASVGDLLPHLLSMGNRYRNRGLVGPPFGACYAYGAHLVRRTDHATPNVPKVPLSPYPQRRGGRRLSRHACSRSLSLVGRPAGSRNARLAGGAASVDFDIARGHAYQGPYQSAADRTVELPTLFRATPSRHPVLFLEKCWAATPGCALLSATAWKCTKTGKMKMVRFSGIKFD